MSGKKMKKLIDEIFGDAPDTEPRRRLAALSASRDSADGADGLDDESLDAGTLAAYLGAGLTDKEREELESRLARSPALREQLMEAAAWLEEVAEAPRKAPARALERAVALAGETELRVAAAKVESDGIGARLGRFAAALTMPRWAPAAMAVTAALALVVVSTDITDRIGAGDADVTTTATEREAPASLAMPSEKPVTRTKRFMPRQKSAGPTGPSTLRHDRAAPPAGRPTLLYDRSAPGGETMLRRGRAAPGGGTMIYRGRAAPSAPPAYRQQAVARVTMALTPSLRRALSSYDSRRADTRAALLARLGTRCGPVDGLTHIEVDTRLRARLAAGDAKLTEIRLSRMAGGICIITDK